MSGSWYRLHQGQLPVCRKVFVQESTSATFLAYIRHDAIQAPHEDHSKAIDCLRQYSVRIYQNYNSQKTPQILHLKN